MDNDNQDRKKEFKIDISSTAIESSIELAKDFVGRLVNPSVEELGLLIKDKISYWRFSNQIKILNKAKLICEKNNVSIKSISPKLLCPYLENASLEDNDDLQDKWAALLVNMVDSKKNVQNHVFPYILSQLSKEEFDFLESNVNNKNMMILNLKNELTLFLETKEEKEKIISSKIESLNDRLKEFKTYSSSRFEILKEISDLERQLSNQKYTETRINFSINEPIEIREQDLKEFEIANIIRLGLAKIVYEVTAGTQSIYIPEISEIREKSIDFDIDIGNDSKTIITELGEIFIKACQNKRFL